MRRLPGRKWFLAVALFVFLGVLSFYRPGAAAPKGAQPPFANAVAQRREIIEQLKELNQNLRQQNTLLQSGKIRVVLTKPKKGK